MKRNDLDISDIIKGMVNTTRSANRSNQDRDPLLSGLLSNYTSSSDNCNNNHNDTDNTLGRLMFLSGPCIPPPAGGGGVTAAAAIAPLHSILINGVVSTTSTGDYVTSALPCK